MHAEQLGIALRGFLVHLQFELDLGFGGEDLERALPGFQNAVDLSERFVELALHVKGNRLCQAGRFGACLSDDVLEVGWLISQLIFPFLPSIP